jgi:hypothetical protein
MMSYAGFTQAEVTVFKFLLAKGFEAAAQYLTGTNGAYTNNMNVQSFVGQTANTQQLLSTQHSTGFQQLASFMTGTGAVSTAGAVQLQATKAQMQAIAATATAQGYTVWPTGVVTPGPRHIAECSANWHTWGAARWKLYQKQAASYTAGINGTLAQASTIDQQIATALIKVMTDTLGSFLQKKLAGDTGSPTVPTPTTLPATPPGTTVPGSVPTTVPGLAPPTVTTDPLPSGGLAGVTPLGGGGPVPGGAGAIGLPGGGAAAPGAVSLAGGAAGAAGLLGVGATPAGGAAAGARGGMVGGMMPMAGGAGAHRGAGEHSTSTWLDEDDNPFGADDAPDGVVG